MTENVLEWSKIRLAIKVRDSKAKAFVERTLLEDQCGKVHTGQLVAIMGPTGCGKSSLMNVLAGKVSFSRNVKLQGNIYLNGEFMNHGLSTNMVAYVAQDETMFAFLTVKETLMLSAYFHSSASISLQAREDLVQTIMRELSLLKTENTILGNETRRGVSGGEYKRVLIGKELIKKPQIILLDEPTSGLDSYQALSVMDTMKRLAQRGRIVITVIHQPRSSIFALFDRLLLLSDGQQVYFGPATDALGYFQSLGYQCPQHFNPADYFLDILSVETKTVEMEEASRSRISGFVQYWKLHRPTLVELENRRALPVVTSSKRYDSERLDAQAPSKACSSWCSDFAVLFRRSSQNIYRNYGALLIRGVTSLFFAILVSLIYRNLGYTQKDLQNRTGLLYFVLINQGFSPLIGALNSIPPEKLIVSREVTAGSYRFSAYYVGRVLAELPSQIFFAVIYCTIIYWSSGLNPLVDRFFIFVAVITLTTLNAASLGFLVSSVSPSAAIANAIGPPIFIILLLYGGFYINSSSLPVGSVWVRNLSLVYWGFQALVINEFSGATFNCANSATGACITSGNQQINSLSFATGSVGLCALYLIILTVGFFILGYFGLLLSKKRYCRLQPVTDEDETLTRFAAHRSGDNDEDYIKEEPQEQDMLYRKHLAKPPSLEPESKELEMVSVYYQSKNRPQSPSSSLDVDVESRPSRHNMDSVNTDTADDVLRSQSRSSMAWYRDDTTTHAPTAVISPNGTGRYLPF